MTRSAAEQEAPMGKKTGYLLSSLLFLGLVAYIVYKVRTNSEWQNFDLAHFQATLGRLDYRILLIALTIVYSTYLLRSLRWREFLLPIKPTSVSNLLTATIIGFGGLVLLGRPGELVRPYLISRKEDMPVSTQMAVWVLERVYDLSMIVVIVGGVTYFSVWGEELSQGRTQALLHIRAAGLIILTLTLCGILGLVLFRCYWQSWVPRLLALIRFLPPRLLGKVRELLEQFGQGLCSLRSGRAFLMGVLYTTLVWMSISVGFFITLKAFGPPLSDFSYAAAVLVMGFAIAGSMLQVPGIGGGTQVFTIIALTELFGVRPEMATSAALILWLLTFVAVVPLALIFSVREGLSWRKLRLLAAAE